MENCSFPWITAYIQHSEPHWSTTLTACLTPIIAILTLWIAYNQFMTAKRKLKLDLFEKRLAVYDVVNSTIVEIMASGKTNNDIENNFTIWVSCAKWLFDDKMAKYLNDELWKEIVNLGKTQGMTENAPPSEERTKYIYENAETKIRISHHLSIINDKFYPFLFLRH